MMKTAPFAAAAACALFTARVEAMPAPEPIRTELVNYTDLDLDSKAGQASLKGRIRRAAMQVCTLDRYLVLSCYDAAIADALKQVRELIDARESRRASPAVAVRRR